MHGFQLVCLPLGAVGIRIVATLPGNVLDAVDVATVLVRIVRIGVRPVATTDFTVDVGMDRVDELTFVR